MTNSETEENIDISYVILANLIIYLIGFLIVMTVYFFLACCDSKKRKKLKEKFLAFFSIKSKKVAPITDDINDSTIANLKEDSNN